MFKTLVLLSVLGLVSCGKGGSNTASTSAAAYSAMPNESMRWHDSNLNNGLSLTIATEVASALDYGSGDNGYSEDALEWNNALPGKTFFALPFPIVANREKATLASYNDDEMGIYKSQNWFPELGKGVLAITQYFGVRRFDHGKEYIEFQHADIILNFRDYTFSSDLTDVTSFDLPSVLLHEMGHFVGLQHELSTHQSIMWPALRRNESERQLFPIDIQNLQTNYGVANASNVKASAITSPSKTPDSEIVQGHFELRANGDCVHFSNGKQIHVHHVEGL